MQQPSSHRSPDLPKETCISVELLSREADLQQGNAAVSGRSSPEDAFSSSPTQTESVCVDTTVPPGDSIHLKPPAEEATGSPQGPFQFNRQALARISTSPTLRRLRMASASQAGTSEECCDTAQMGAPKESTSCLHHVCKSPPRCAAASSPPLPSCAQAKLSSKTKPETTTAGPEPASSTPKLPSQETLLSNSSPSETLQGSWRANSATLPRRLPWPSLTPQEGVQRSGLPGQRPGERRRSSVVVTLPGLEVFPGDLLVSDGAMDHLPYTALLLSAESKKPRWPFARRGAGKDRQRQASDVENCLSTLKIMDCSTDEFLCFKSKSWADFVKAQQRQQEPSSQSGGQKEAAVWELFTTECNYFLDHLLVLKMVFVDTLKYLQSKEFLLDVDLWRLFANLEELNAVSLSFLKAFFEAVKEHVRNSDSPLDFSSILSKFFQGDLCQTHQIYCLNYTSAVFYLENLRQREDFGLYLKWCEQNQQCKRLHLPELLVAPLQRLTRYPLLLNNICQRSTDPAERALLQSLKEKVEKSIWDLEGKVKWLDNFQKLRQLQEVIIWPQLWDRDKRFFVPECLKQSLRENSSENILASANRLLLHEGRLTLAESTRLLEVHLFLFDDFLLITKIKRSKKRCGGSEAVLPVCPSFPPELQSLRREGGFCTVLDQPIPLDRLSLRNMDPVQVAAFSLRNAFLVQHENRYCQSIAAFLLQAHTEAAKK
ncbi:pleckstrin homology domain-containing family G member 7 [Dryobates pubescens]|uniref:pleckstrin homology domain-containing family G member 7 n=1 Tax=Dryobates pubescens TaxID=118200 RepID=UPI0023B8D98E|nr:pleckstrin homology domain-containing family G member 7 [Dryobates pubescens]